MALSQIKSGALLSYVSLFIGSCISIVYTPIMLRLLGQSEYGLMTLANSVIGYLSLLNLGIGSAMVRYISKYKAKNDKEREYGLMTLFATVFLGISFIILLAGGILIANAHYIFDKTLTPNEFQRLKILMGLMTFNMAIGVNSSVFYAVVMAYERFIFTKLVGIINTVINPLIMLPLLYNGYQSIGMTVASTILNIINVAIVVFYCFHQLKVRLKWVKFDKPFLKELFGFSFYIIFAMIVDKIYWGTDQMILGAVSGTEAVAIYNVGANFTTYFMTFSTAISGLFLPRLTEMTTRKATDQEFTDIFIKVGRVQFLILAFVLGGFITLGKPFICLWAGYDYKESYFIALVILIPFIIPLIQNIGLQLMYARNQHKFRSIVLFFIAIVNVAVSIPLAKTLGGLGCALATGVSYILGQGFVLNWFYQKKMKLNVVRFWKEISVMCIPLTLTLVLSSLIFNYLNCDNWKIFLISTCIYCAIYISIMWKFSMNNFEHQLILEYIPINRKK